MCARKRHANTAKRALRAISVSKAVATAGWLPSDVAVRRVAAVVATFACIAMTITTRAGLGL
jgi:hypothetical protein